MAFVDTTDFDHVIVPTAGWDKLVAHLDLGRLDAELRPRPLQAEMADRAHHVQKMLLASLVAAGTIIAVAGVMMMKFL